VADGVFRGRERRCGAICRSTCAALTSKKRVWRALRAIPAGETTSYGAIRRKQLGDAGALARQWAPPTAPTRSPSSCRVTASSDLDRFAYGVRRRARSQEVAARPRTPLAARTRSFDEASNRGQPTRTRSEEIRRLLARSRLSTS
jgi:hypothetical protein